MIDRRNLIIGITFMVLSVIFFPLKDALAKLTGGHYSAILIVWTQFTFTGSVFLTTLLIRQGAGALQPQNPGMQILRSLTVVFAMGLFYRAIQLIPLAEATAMQFIAPLVATALSTIFLNEKVGVRRWLSSRAKILCASDAYPTDAGGATVSRSTSIFSYGP